MESSDVDDVRWVVVGGGPCGILAVSLLVEYVLRQRKDRTGDEALSHKIAWIDPYFRVGNLPRWREVQANSSVQAICSSFAAIPSLRFHELQKSRAEQGLRTLTSLLPEQLEDSSTVRKVWCELGLVVDALEDATTSLLKQECVIGVRGQVTSMAKDTRGEQRCWRVEFAASGTTEHDQEEPQKDEQEQHRGILASLHCQRTSSNSEEDSHSTSALFKAHASPIFASTVVLATGAAPKKPPRRFQTNLEVIDLETALISANLRSVLRWKQPSSCLSCPEGVSWHELRWTVVGSSHSAMLVVRNLVGLGVKKIQIVHRRPLFYVEPRNEPPGPLGGTWLKHIGTGLLGTTGSWCRKELPLLERSGRIEWQCFPNRSSGDEDMEDWVLRNSDVLVFAAGFDPAQLPSIHTSQPLNGMSSLRKSKISDSSRNAHYGAATEAVRDRSRSPQSRTHGPSSVCDPLFGISDLVGLGIGFPERHVEPDGDVDVRVGFVRHYIEYAAHVLGLGTDWLEFDHHMKTV